MKNIFFVLIAMCCNLAFSADNYHKIMVVETDDVSKHKILVDAMVPLGKTVTIINYHTENVFAYKKVGWSDGPRDKPGPGGDRLQSYGVKSLKNIKTVGVEPNARNTSVTAISEHKRLKAWTDTMTLQLPSSITPSFWYTHHEGYNIKIGEYIQKQMYGDLSIQTAIRSLISMADRFTFMSTKLDLTLKIKIVASDGTFMFFNPTKYINEKGMIWEPEGIYDEQGKKLIEKLKPNEDGVFVIIKQSNVPVNIHMMSIINAMVSIATSYMDVQNKCGTELDCVEVGNGKEYCRVVPVRCD